MAIPILSEREPIMDNIPIASDAAGKEAIASAFGDVGHEFFGIGQEALSEIKQVKKQESNAMLASALNDETKNTYDAKIKMIQNPNMGNQILESAQNNSNAILQSAKLNREDQQRLKMVMTESQGQLGVDNAHEQYDLYKRMAFIKQYDDYTSLLNQIQNTSNPEAQQILIDTASKSSEAAVRNGIITPEHYDVQHKTLMSIVGQRQAVNDLPGNIKTVDDTGSSNEQNVSTQQNITPQQHHQVNFNPLNPSQNVTPDAPMNQGAKYLYSVTMDTHTESDILAHLAQGLPVNSSDYAKIKGTETFDRVTQAAVGTSVANSFIDSNTPFLDIQNKYDELNNKEKLTTSQQAMRDRLGYYLKQHNNGGATEQLLNTVGGVGLTNDYKNNRDAIQLSNFAPQQKAQMTNELDNRYGDQVVSLGMANGIPLSQLDPIAGSMTKQAQSAFSMQDPKFPSQGDPNSLIQTLKYYKQSLRPFVAMNMKTPVQKEIAYSTSLLMNVPSTGYDEGNLKTWIIANQEGGLKNSKGQDFSSLRQTGSPSDEAIRLSVSSKLSDTLNYLKMLPGSGERINSLTRSAVNYVKRRSSDSNDLTMSHSDQYIDEVSNLIAKSYNIQTGSSSAINLNQRDLTPSQQSVIEEYTKDRMYKKYGAGMTRADYESVLDHNPVFITFNPVGNQVMAIDKSGTVMEVYPYDDKVLAAAHKMVEDNK